MTVVSARRAATRERLVEAAVRVFAEKGVEGATVEEICEAAGFTRGAFYSNFDNKDALGVAVFEHHTALQTAALERTVASLPPRPQDNDPDALVADALTLFFASRHDERHWVLATQELRLQAARSPEMAAAFQRQQRCGETAVAQTLECAIAAHGYCLTVSAVEAVGVLHAVHDHANVSALIDPAGGSDPAEHLLATVLRALLRPASDAGCVSGDSGGADA